MASAGMKLDVTKITKPDAQQAAAEDTNIALLLELPDGTSEVMKFRADLTVGFVKTAVAKRHHIPFDQQELELDGKPLADPLSLSDYPQLKQSRAANPVRIVLRRVSPEDGEADDDEAGDAEGGEKAGATSDYDDESFED